MEPRDHALRSNRAGSVAPRVQRLGQIFCCTGAQVGGCFPGQPLRCIVRLTPMVAVGLGALTAQPLK
jgi:hypothetical protein